MPDRKVVIHHPNSRGYRSVSVNGRERRPRLPPAAALEVERLAAAGNPRELLVYRERLRARAVDLASFINCWRELGALPRFRHNDVD